MKKVKNDGLVPVNYKNKLNGEVYVGLSDPTYVYIDGEKFMKVVSVDKKRFMNIKADVLVKQ